MVPGTDSEAQRSAVCCELVAEVARTSGEVRLQVNGGSMLPAIWPGDVVTVRSRDLAELQPGQIVLYRREGKLTAHRVMHISADHLIARGDSLPSSDLPVRATEVVGQVVNIHRNGRHIQPEHSLGKRVISSILRRSDFWTRMTLFLGVRLRRSRIMQVSWATSS